MKFEIYCDESGLEALSDRNAHNFTAIGGIWMTSSYRNVFKSKIKEIKEKHKVYGELKWNKISPKFKELYREVIDYFFQTPQLRFRTIIIDTSKVDNYHFSNNDVELGFYKFYYQLLHHWIFDFNDYSIFLDHKVNRDKNRLKDLKRVLDLSNLTSGIPIVQALPSEESAAIQLADILTGLTNAKFNNKTTSQTKLELIQYIEETYLGNRIGHTPKHEEKYNVFLINLNGGW